MIALSIVDITYQDLHGSIDLRNTVELAIGVCG